MIPAISTDKNLTVSAKIPSDSDKKTALREQGTSVNTDANNPQQSKMAATSDTDFERASQLLDLAEGTPSAPANSGIQNVQQAHTVLDRLKTLFNENPDAALLAQGSGKNPLLSALLEVDPGIERAQIAMQQN